MRSAWTRPEGRGELAHPEVEPVDLVLELAVVAELARELDQIRVGGDEDAALAGRDGLGRVERVDAGVAEAPRLVSVPLGAVGVGAVLEQEDPVVAAVLGDALGVEGDVAADVDEDRGLRLVRARPCASKSSKDMQRSSRLQSTNSTSAPALIAASGVAMKVLDGQSTVSPRTPANSSAASAPPAQLERPRLGSPFHSAQRASKASSIRPSDHCSESSTSAQSSKSLGRSRWSNPIANLLASIRLVSADPTVAPWQVVWLGKLRGTKSTEREAPQG